MDIELPDNLVRAMTKMDDIVNLLAGTNEKLTIIEPELLDISLKKASETKKMDIKYNLMSFIQTTPTDFYDIIYNS